MIARVDGQAVPLEYLGWPAMNFGQFRWNAPIGNYELTIPRESFLNQLRSTYDKCAAELQADDVHDPDGVPHLREIDYPPFAEVLDHPRQFDELVRIFLYEDVFAAFLPHLPSSVWFMLNSVESVFATDAVVIIRGRGFHLDSGRPAEPIT